MTTAIIGSSGSTRIPCWTDTSAASRFRSIVVRGASISERHPVELLEEIPLHDLEAVVTRFMPGKMRVAVLLEFLGRQTVAEIDTAALLKPDQDRPRVLIHNTI